MPKLKHKYLYYYRKTHLMYLKVAIQYFLFEANKLLPIAKEYSRFNQAQKKRYDNVVDEIRHWLYAMEPEKKKVIEE